MLRPAGDFMGCIFSAPFAREDAYVYGGGRRALERPGARDGGEASPLGALDLSRPCWRAGGAEDERVDGGEASPLGALDLSRPCWRAGGAEDARVAACRRPSRLRALRDEFWETQPAYGGAPDMWAALRSAAEAAREGDEGLAQAIVGAAGIRAGRKGLKQCWDERGGLYRLPDYVLADPIDLQRH